MEKLIDSGMISAAVDLTTTEVADMMTGGVFAATDDRFGAVIRTGIPYVGSVGALDMVNWGAPDTVPERFKDRLLHVHNPRVTLMRTTPEENRRMGVWIAERLNRMTGPVRLLWPQGGISALDAPGEPFWNPEADAALFAGLKETFRETASKRLVALPHHINAPDFADAAVRALREVAPRNPGDLRAQI